MSHINFAEALWREQEKYMKERDNYIGRFNAFQNVFNYFETGQTVAQIACGSILEDLFLTMEKVGKKGRIILIDEDPAFIYNRVLRILGDENLSKEKEFYTQTEQGKQILRDFFSQANIEAYVERLPPYPPQIKNESIDHVMAINAAFELMATPLGGKPADVEGLITETYKKLRKKGSLIVQGLMAGDIDFFATHVYNAIEKKGLCFDEDFTIQERLYGPLSYAGLGYWARWVKKE